MWSGFSMISGLMRLLIAASFTGRRTKLSVMRPTQPVAMSAPRCGPQMKTARESPPGCDVDDCVDAQWAPFIAAPDARPVGSWALVKLPDGKQQWAYKGQKLYTNVLDKKPGDFRGIRFGGDRSWSAIMRSGDPMQGVSVGG